MPRLPGVNHLQAVRALEKSGFTIKRQGKHIAMTNGHAVLIIPRNDPINAFTMASIVEAAGLSLEQFRRLL